jgi:hypothetical protein
MEDAVLNRIRSALVKISSKNRDFSSATTYKPALPVIDARSPIPQFNQQVFTALKSKGGFVLNNLGDKFSSTTIELFTAYQDFLQQPDAVKKPFLGLPNSTILKGFFPYKSFFAGGRCCDRFFINQTSAGFIGQALPSSTSAVSMPEAVTGLGAFTQQIIARTISAMEIGLAIPHQVLSQIIQDHTLLTVVDSYLPVTQEKLIYWLQMGKLTKTADGRIEMFLPHKDLMPLSVLIYGDNQTHGLEVKTPDEDGKLSFKPLCLQSRSPYRIQAVVIAGLVMEHLTDGLVKGLEHRVVANPLPSGQRYKRQAINSFVIIDADLNPALKPLVRAPDGPHYATVPMTTFYDTQVKEYYEGEKTRIATTQLTEADLAPFPMEDEIETINRPTGVSYRRR